MSVSPTLLDQTLAPPTTVWGPPTTAVTRLAAADHLRRHHGLPLPPVHHPLLDRRRGQLLETLGQETFDRAWASGSETGPDGLGGLLAAP